MSICKHVISPAKLGEYELHVSQIGASDTVHGFRSVNGVKVESWEHSDLVGNSPQKFTVGEGERHSVNVIATFAADDTFKVDLQYDDQSLCDCELKKAGYTSANIGILASVGG